MNAEILAIGDEIISGRILDTNSQWLSIRLEDLGIRVLYHTAVADELEPLKEVFRQALERSDLVISTGGLGPSGNDLTREALAAAVGRALVTFPEALEHLQNLFTRRGRPLTEAHKKQALFPEGARMVPNPHGTAPGIELEVPRPGRSPGYVFCLPGVPAEMQDIFTQTVAARLLVLRGDKRVIIHRDIRTFGAPESQVEAMLPDLIRRGRDPRVGINASQGTIILRVMTEGADEAECRAKMEPTVKTIYSILGNLVFGENEDELQDAVLRLLEKSNKTLATAEWATGGMVAHWLNGVPGASRWYRGGWVANSLVGWQAIGELPPDVVAQQDLKSGRLVAAIAAACRQQFQTDFGLAIGPFPQDLPHADSPGGVHLALATVGETATRTVGIGGHPSMLRVFCGKHALNFLRLYLLEHS